MTRVAKKLVAFLIVCVAIPIPAIAQGKSGSAPGKNKPDSGGAAAAAAATVSPATATAATSTPASAPNTVLYYGSWLDDASVMTPGTIWAGASTSYWKAATARQVDAPVVMGAVGVAPRIQVGGSLPIYHFRDQAGLSASGVGTISAYGKVMLIDPSVKRGIGLALVPLIELAPGSDQRFGWALPVNVELRTARMRLYGSAGYFSRGSIFGTVAVEMPVSQRTAVTASFGQSHAGGFHQTSISASLSVSATPTTGFFVSIGHASAAENLTNAGVSMGGGISFTRLARSP